LGAHSPPKPYQPPEQPAGKINLTDPDSRNVKTQRGWVQGYNAQAVTTEDQIVIAAEVHVSTADFGQLEPMITAAATSARAPASSSHRRSCSPTPLLAPRPDGAARRRGSDGARSAGRQQARGRAAGLERRALRLHASRPGTDQGGALTPNARE
jgi:hypothetical protein